MKIYLSSTFEDLINYRQTVYDQLRKLRQDVISMEDYVAGDKRPLSKCLEDVAGCEIYVGIVAWRYGFIPLKGNPSKLSITELEYRHALKLKKQCLIFILERDQAWSPQFMDSQLGGKSGAKNIVSFRSRLEERHIVGWFKTPDQLASNVVAAVYKVQYEARQPAPSSDNAEVQPIEQTKITKAASAGIMAKRPGYPILWKSGTTIRISFLNGSKRQISLVKRFASIWCAYGNIMFEFVNHLQAEVRVSFNANDGSWSHIGTNALVVMQKEPTVNFGWLSNNIRDIEAETIILKQFGHVLGLMNEHLNPSAKMPWDKDAIYDTYLKEPNFWSREDVNTMMFQTWAKKSYPASKPFDPESIMFFRFPPEFTAGKIIAPAEEGLSQGDKQFISKLYPFHFTKDSNF